MKIKFIVLSLTVLLASSQYVFANEEYQHHMIDGTVMNDEDMSKGQTDSESTKAIEVGNKICPVSGDKIPAPGEKGTMGDEPVKYEYNGKIYNLCCPMCIKDFKKNPEKYSKIADDEVAKEKMMEQEKDQKEDQKDATK